ncbi:MAG: hypothetical protein AAF065_13955 [Verrucomicrobiota bacterium]
MNDLITPNLALDFLNAFGDNGAIIAQVGVEAFMTRVLNMFRLISILFAVIGLMYAAFQLNQGDVRLALMGVCAAGLMGAAYVIVVSLFGDADSGIEIEGFIEI